ncbi:heparan-alpha-glucosaminide N-acetyltransferase [Bosea sp. UNC402CLCol]|uniref:heparan-alpha-glucosaminide N-acetyltransferase n=1 Tax=Bosea sp. UNC402CLCol TaxID=1510531 RepID=UPI0006916308|nr:heparan-alpha-glucosaminide N-acetyltransferase [Bosea sp. UNC402CLCol]
MTEPAAAASPAPTPPSLPKGGRIQLVDLARGIALLAMFVFHFAYDLSNFGLIETDIAFEPGWRLFARCIAGSFLVVVGVSLVLATRKGLNRNAFLKRLAMVAAAAALVTVGTFFAMRENFIFFGILHHVALASVLALPFLRLPVLLVILAAALAFALPAFVASPLLDQPWTVWLGFSHAPIQTADFVPVFPWFGCVLTGIALARLVLPRLDGTAAASWRPRPWPTRIICWGGRHSLLVYLVHQPVFIGLIMLATQIAPPLSPDERAFRAECQRSCAGPSNSQQICREVCACTVDGLKRENLWQKALSDTLSSEESTRMTRLAQACLRGP